MIGRETNYLKEGVSMPDDRPGTVIFENGTVVQSKSGDLSMFTLNEAETELIEALAFHAAGILFFGN